MASPSREKDNFLRISVLLIDGGTKLLREVLNNIHSPASLQAALARPEKERELNKARLLGGERKKLYPPGGGVVKSEDLDITLLSKLLRHVCNLTPPTSGWDKLPNAAHKSQADDLVRIRICRNEVVAHATEMKLEEHEFHRIWNEISSAMIRLAKCISGDKETEWKILTEQYLSAPMTSVEQDRADELRAWYENDTVLTEEMRAGFEDLGRDMAGLSQGIQDIKDLVGNKQGMS